MNELDMYELLSDIASIILIIDSDNYTEEVFIIEQKLDESRYFIETNCGFLFYHWNNIRIPIYYSDYFCIHRCCYDIHNKLITNWLIQTHEYNQRINNEMIQVSF